MTSSMPLRSCVTNIRSVMAKTDRSVRTSELRQLKQPEHGVVNS